VEGRLLAYCADEEDAVSGPGPPVAPPVVAADEKLRRDDLGVVEGVEEGCRGCTWRDARKDAVGGYTMGVQG
jgi:hypothetical protein